MYRQRFGLSGHPLPKNAQARTFFDKTPGYKKLDRAFRQTVDDPGLGVLTAEAGVGKTAAIRNLCASLPKPDHLVLYLCDTAVAPLDLYRTLATEIGVKPSHRRAQLWTDIKKTLVHMVDERGTCPVIILDSCGVPGYVEWPHRSACPWDFRGCHLHITGTGASRLIRAPRATRGWTHRGARRQERHRRPREGGPWRGRRASFRDPRPRSDSWSRRSRGRASD